jgi:hypothetical protein
VVVYQRSRVRKEYSLLSYRKGGRNKAAKVLEEKICRRGIGTDTTRRLHHRQIKGAEFNTD